MNFTFVTDTDGKVRWKPLYFYDPPDTGWMGGWHFELRWLYFKFRLLVPIVEEEKMPRIDYSSNEVPDDYRCCECGAHGYKMWREYQSFGIIKYWCVNCAEKSQNKKHDPEFSDAIGWRVPAIPDEEGVGCWGYTSVPKEGIDWWKKLPTRPGESQS